MRPDVKCIAKKGRNTVRIRREGVDHHHVERRSCGRPAFHAGQSLRCPYAPRGPEACRILSETKSLMAVVGRSYRAVEVAGLQVWKSGQRRNLTRSLKAMSKLRSPVEPTIGHMKNHGKLGRNWLKGALSDAMHAVLCGAGHNIRLIITRDKGPLGLIVNCINPNSCCSFPGMLRRGCTVASADLIAPRRCSARTPALRSYRQRTRLRGMTYFQTDWVPPELNAATDPITASSSLCYTEQSNYLKAPHFARLAAPDQGVPTRDDVHYDAPLQAAAEREGRSPA